jgi:hypothetical protein
MFSFYKAAVYQNLVSTSHFFHVRYMTCPYFYITLTSSMTDKLHEAPRYVTTSVHIPMLKMQMDISRRDYVIEKYEAALF